MALLPGAFGPGVAEVDEILLNSVRHAFLPPDRKRSLEARVRAELDRLKAAEFG